MKKLLPAPCRSAAPPAARLATTLLLLWLSAAPPGARAQEGGGLPVALPDTSAQEGDTLRIPVYLKASAAGEDVIAYQLEVRFDPSVIRLLGASSRGTLTDGWLLSDTAFEDRLRVASASSRALAGAPGVLVFLDVAVVGEGTSALAFTDLLLNEGAPAARATDGSLTTRARSPNRPPAARPDTAQTHVGAAVEIDVLQNDADPDGDALTVIGLVGADGGAAGAAEVIRGGRAVRYTPPGRGQGLVVVFGYEVADGRGNIAAATVTVTVLPAASTPPRVTGHPNPFRNQTAITYVLPQEAHVHLAIYDTLGRKVAVLVDGQRQDAGFKEVLWEARAGATGHLSSGLYLCRLRVDETVRTAGLLLLR